MTEVDRSTIARFATTMNHRMPSQTIVVATELMFAVGTAMLYGCDGPKDSARMGLSPANPQRISVGAVATGADDRTASAQNDQPTLVDARPAALINGKPLSWNDLRPTLSELGGAEALQEVILDRQIQQAATAAGLTITADSAAAERKLLLESLSDDPNQAVQLLDELRAKQNLGKYRFEALMMRNAALRALVRNSVVITDEAIRNMHELVHGPKRQPRIMVLPNLEAAQAAINLVNSGISFADVAAEMSIDSSAPRGGLLEPISRVDPAFPEAIRQTLWSLDPGQMSGPVLLDDRYAVVMLLKRVAGDNTRVEDMRTALERAVRIQQERLLMDQLARRLLADTQVTVFDEHLHEGWSRRGR